MDLTQSSQRTNLITITLLIIALITSFFSILYFDIPFFKNFYLWFIEPHKTPLNLNYIYFALACLLIATGAALSKAKTIVKLFLILLTGVIIHYAFGLAKGNIDYIKDRMIHTGHASYIGLAINTENVPGFIQNYETASNNGSMGSYAPTKPPGTALIYIVYDRLASALNGESKQRAEKLINLATYTWPLISYIPVILIFIFGRKIIGDQNAIIASLLYVTIPSVNLINLHTDQTFYPSLGLLSGILLLNSVRVRLLTQAFLAGCIFFLATFLSFGMAPLMILFFGAIFLTNPVVLSLKIMAVFLSGFLLAWLPLYLFFDYNHYSRYLSAITYHQNSKGWEGTWDVFFAANITNIVEYLIWIGLPISTLLVYSMLTFWRKEKRLNRLYVAMAISLMATFLFLLIFGKTKSETARLWMYLNPFVCIYCACVIADLTKFSLLAKKSFTFFIIIFQFFANFLILRFLDFI